MFNVFWLQFYSYIMEETESEALRNFSMENCAVCNTL